MASMHKNVTGMVLVSKDTDPLAEKKKSMQGENNQQAVLPGGWHEATFPNLSLTTRLQAKLGQMVPEDRSHKRHSFSGLHKIPNYHIALVMGL